MFATRLLGVAPEASQPPLLIPRNGRRRTPRAGGKPGPRSWLSTEYTGPGPGGTGGGPGQVRRQLRPPSLGPDDSGQRTNRLVDRVLFLSTRRRGPGSKGVGPGNEHLLRVRRPGRLVNARDDWPRSLKGSDAVSIWAWQRSSGHEGRGRKIGIEDVAAPVRRRPPCGRSSPAAPQARGHAVRGRLKVGTGGENRDGDGGPAPVNRQRFRSALLDNPQARADAPGPPTGLIKPAGLRGSAPRRFLAVTR